ncbi:MAG: hypothetical protein EXS36_06635 [Pedosphaera sp.]|nr:hypothetical protein [Pedosphaera sp.]
MPRLVYDSHPATGDFLDQFEVTEMPLRLKGHRRWKFGIGRRLWGLRGSRVAHGVEFDRFSSEEASGAPSSRHAFRDLGTAVRTRLCHSFTMDRSWTGLKQDSARARRYVKRGGY